MTTEERINRGAAAKRLMEDEILTGAFTAVREGYIQAWVSSGQHDVDGRERAYRKLTVLGEVQDQIESYITDGAMARSKT